MGRVKKQTTRKQRQKIDENTLNAILATTPDIRNLYQSYVKFVDGVIDFYEETINLLEDEGFNIFDHKEALLVKRMEELKRDCFSGIRLIYHMEEAFFTGKRSIFKKFTRRHLSTYKRFVKRRGQIDSRTENLLSKLKDIRECDEDFGDLEDFNFSDF